MVNYDDHLYRKLVKDFYQKHFWMNLIDTPNTVYEGTDRIASIGKYEIDLIPENETTKLAGVEVETVRTNNDVFNEFSSTFNVLVSKYWKYCNNSFSKPVELVYVEIDKNNNPTGRIAIINGCCLKAYKDAGEFKYLSLASKINKTGSTELYSFSKDPVVINKKLTDTIKYF